MGSFETRRNVLRKTTGISEKDLTSGQPHRLRAIVKVRIPGYVPENVAVSSRVDDEVFTAEFGQDLLDALEKDEDVTSIAVSEDLGIIE